MPAEVTEIPTLDLARTREPARRATALAELRCTLVNVGFLYIKNHNVPQTTITKLVDSLPHLFALPQEAKEEVALINSPHFLGYSKFGSELTAKKADHREQLEFATELPLPDPNGKKVPLFIRLHGPNQWPKAYPELREIVEDYVTELTKLAESFLELVAEAFELPQDLFFQFLSDQHRLKLVHYKASAVQDANQQSQGVGPHKDSSGWITFLLQASPPSVKGLQVLTKEGQWIDVPVVPRTFVVNMGQAFEVVTNGIIKATTHRVLITGQEDRYSIPFFQGVRKTLTKDEMRDLWGHFKENFADPHESEEGKEIDSAFLKGGYFTVGEAQLRTKIRSHQDVGRKHYPDVFDKYVSDDMEKPAPTTPVKWQSRQLVQHRLDK